MKFAPVQNIVRGNVKRPSNLWKFLQDFAESGAKTVEVLEHDYKSASVGASCLNIAIKRYHMYHLHAMYRGKHLYLTNDLVDNDK